MASDDLLKKIFEHQLLLSKEIQKRLEKYIDEELKTAFEENESYLKELLEKTEVRPEELDKLQRLWESLTGRIQKMRKDKSPELQIVEAEEKIARLYN